MAHEFILNKELDQNFYQSLSRTITLDSKQRDNEVAKILLQKFSAIYMNSEWNKAQGLIKFYSKIQIGILKQYLSTPELVKNLVSGATFALSRAVDLFIAPISFPIKSLGKSIRYAKKLKAIGIENVSRIPVELIDKDSLMTVPLWATLLFAGHQMVISFDVFEDTEVYRKEASLNDSYKEILYVNGVLPGENLDYAAKQDFIYRYGDNENAEYLDAFSFSELNEKVAELANRGKSFDRIEIFGHGRPGQIYIGNSPLDKVNASKLAFKKILKDDSEIFMISCSLGENTVLGNNGTELIKEIGKYSFPKRGKIITSSRILIYIDHYSDADKLAGKDMIAPEKFYEVLTLANPLYAIMLTQTFLRQDKQPLVNVMNFDNSGKD